MVPLQQCITNRPFVLVITNGPLVTVLTNGPFVKVFTNCETDLLPSAKQSIDHGYKIAAIYALSIYTNIPFVTVLYKWSICNSPYNWSIFKRLLQVEKLTYSQARYNH